MLAGALSAFDVKTILGLVELKDQEIESLEVTETVGTAYHCREEKWDLSVSSLPPLPVV